MIAWLRRWVAPPPEQALRDVVFLQRCAAGLTLLAAVICAALSSTRSGGLELVLGSGALGVGALALVLLAQGLSDRSRLARRLDLLLMLALVVVAVAPFLWVTPVPRKLLRWAIPLGVGALWSLAQLLRPSVAAALGPGLEPLHRERDRFGLRASAWCAGYLGMVLGAAWARATLLPAEWLPGPKSPLLVLHVLGCLGLAGVSLYALHLVLRQRARAARPEVAFETLQERARALRAEGHSLGRVAGMLQAEGLPAPEGDAWTSTQVRAALGPGDPLAPAIVATPRPE